MTRASVVQAKVMAGLRMAGLCIAGLCISSAALADKIGVAAAITNDVQGMAGTTPIPLKVGSEVFTNQRIRTGDASNAQLLFLDETSLNVGPKSEITLDRFVYNPNRHAGSVVLTASKGAFRFVTGSQNPVNYSIKTPVATIGVRGTIVDIRTGVINGVLTTVVSLIEGRVIITTLNGQTLNLDKPGTSFVVKANGTIQGPLTGNGQVATFIGEPYRVDIPDNRLDLTDMLNGRNTRPNCTQHTFYGAGPGSGSSC
jgi:hypothetical protein